MSVRASVPSQAHEGERLVSDTRLPVLAKQAVSELVVAYLVAILASGGDLLMLARLLLAIKLNVFAVPLSWTPVFGALPLWGWYVVAVLWIQQWLFLSNYSAGDAIAQMEAAVSDR